MIFDSLEQFSKKISKTNKILGLDMGNSRIGLALSDENQTISSPFETYQRINNSKDLGYISRICRQEEVGAIVIGLPLNLKGEEEENCLQIRSFAAKLSKKTDLPIFMQDERLSTAAVTRAMQEDNVKRKKRHSLDDKLAASYILQTVLDSLEIEASKT